MIDDYSWFPLEESLCEPHREFLDALLENVPSWEMMGINGFDTFAQTAFGPLTLGFGISDLQASVEIRSLRIDFDGEQLKMGEDDGGQFVAEFRGVEVEEFVGSAIECARVASAWLMREWARPIELKKWWGENPDWHLDQYVLADTGRCLSRSWSRNLTPRKLMKIPYLIPRSVLQVHPPNHL